MQYASRLRGGGIVDLSSEILVAVANSVFVLVVYMIILIHTRKRSKVKRPNVQPAT